MKVKILWYCHIKNNYIEYNKLIFFIIIIIQMFLVLKCKGNQSFENRDCICEYLID